MSMALVPFTQIDSLGKAGNRRRARRDRLEQRRENRRDKKELRRRIRRK